MTKKYFSEEEILETIRKNVDGFTEFTNWNFEDFFDDLFNNGDYFPNHQTAEKVLKEYGIFKALKEVQNWDMLIYGCWKTDYSNIDVVANALESAHAYKVMSSIFTNAPGAIGWYSDLTPEHVKAFKKALSEL